MKPLTQNILLGPLKFPSAHPVPQMIADLFLSLQISLHVLEFYINGIM